MTIKIERIVIEVAGKRFSFDPCGLPLVQSEHPVTIEENGHQYRLRLINLNMVARTCEIEINGRPITGKILRPIDLKIESMGLNASSSKKHSVVTSPMPGLVADIKVQKGQHIEKGEALIILEAMKMENIIAAPHHAVIKEIHVKLGQAVERGFPLVEFDD